MSERDMEESVTIAAGGLRARISLHGAELCSLIGPAGEDLLWQAGPAWPRHAPILFPIVGKLVDDTLRHRGREYRMTQHGFARDRRFTLEERGEQRARFSLEDDAESEACYPFRFRLDLGFRIAAERLTVTCHVTNRGEATLYAALGAHPAFRWPLRAGVAKSAHTLTFSDPEPRPIRRLQSGLLDPQPKQSPIEGSHLALDERLFAEDAVILDHPASRWVRYAAPGCEPVAVAWEGFSALGLWSKPGADFLCIEPWYGMASPRDFTGEFADKPGLFRLAPEESRLFSYSIAVGEAACRALTGTEGSSGG